MRPHFFLCIAFWSSQAFAGGYDTPMLYAAEHMGMGGAANAGVDDGSALFHNPAGLGRVKKGSFLLHLTYLTGTVTGSPDATAAATSITSEPTSAPFPLLAAAYRVHPKVVLGLAAFPIASAGASYRYKGFDNMVTDSTTLVFAEVTPGVGIDLGKIRLGFGYRYTYLLLERFSGGDGADPLIDFTLTGSNSAGFRAGLQADIYTKAAHRLRAGLSYRHQVILRPVDPEARALGFPVTDVTSRFILPSRLIGGLRFDSARWGVAADIEYGFNSQNQKSTLQGTAELAPGVTDTIALDNYFGWKDALTFRLGVEHRLVNGLHLRLGGAYDEQTSNKNYPTAFGTPPAPTTVISTGVGKRFGSWKVDFSLAQRHGKAEVTQADIDAAKDPCVFCGKAGTYAINLNAAYLSVRYDLK